MEIVLFADFSCAPDGHTTVHLKAGEVVSGRVADMAMQAGVGFNPADETKVTPRLERKAARK
jgi:hypothetical protein